MAIDIDLSNFYSIMNTAFWDFFDSKKRIRISFGGAGSSKSYSAFQEIIYKVVAEPGHNFLICRKVATTNKTSTYALTKRIISDLNMWSLFKENKTDMTFTCLANGAMIVFKGLDDIEKIKSITFPTGPLTDVVIEEASEITQKDFDQLNVRLRGQAKVPFQITMLFNPISDQHWIKKEFFDKRSYQKDFEVEILKTTYLDNEFIDDDYRAILEGYKDIDFEFYRVYCLGEWGAFSDIIFNNWTFGQSPYLEEEYDAVYVGMDFGFEHPSVIVKIGFKDGVMYTFDELCVFKHTNEAFIQANEDAGVLRRGQQCIADSAEPARIKEWFQKGYSVIESYKGPDSVSRGIDFINAQRWVIDDTRCPRTAQEVQTYHRKKTKDGRVTEEPVKLFDDAIKAHMYALEPLSRSHGLPGVLSGTKSDQKKEIIEIRKAQRKLTKEVVMAQRRKMREQEAKLDAHSRGEIVRNTGNVEEK